MAGWINRDQQAFIDYQIEQNRVLKDRLEGRPGWPIECLVMIDQCLGLTIDIYGGGQDLIFPHHENKIAQGTCAQDSLTAKVQAKSVLLASARVIELLQYPPPEALAAMRSEASVNEQSPITS